MTSGVIEGFYGRPWTRQQRHRLFDWMRTAGLTTYVYAPKDDLRHRTRWRLTYPPKEAGELKALVAEARRRQCQVVYAIGPGLDLEHSSSRDASALRRRASQLRQLGIRRFALLFDDIAPRLSAQDRARFSSIAAAQAWFANQFWAWLREQDRGATLWFCPTPYCARMCEPSVRESAYLRDLGELLAPEIGVFWTGPEIISEEISVGSIRELTAQLRRPPLIWDNLFANDYDLRRFYLGPYSGRPTALKSVTQGILLNPNCEFELNFVGIATLGAYLRENSRWSPAKQQAAWKQAIQDWTAEFRAEAPTLISTAEVSLLADCFYLPYQQGPRSRRWLDDFQRLLDQPRLRGGPVERRVRAMADAVQRLFDRLTALRNRELLHSVYRPLWELKEEAILMRRYLDWLHSHPPRGTACDSPEHRSGTYRGGLTAQIQDALPMTRDGGFDHRLRTHSRR